MRSRQRAGVKTRSCSIGCSRVWTLRGTGNTTWTFGSEHRDLPDRQHVWPCRYLHHASYRCGCRLAPRPRRALRMTPTVPRARCSTTVGNTSAGQPHMVPYLAQTQLHSASLTALSRRWQTSWRVAQPPRAAYSRSLLRAGGVTPSQRVLRNGCDRIANGLYDSSAAAVYPTVNPVAGPTGFNVVRTGNIPTRCFPENYLIANPQLNNATYNANLGRNNFHSLQVGADHAAHKWV